MKKLQNQIHNNTITRPESDNKLRKADGFWSMFQMVFFLYTRCSIKSTVREKKQKKNTHLLTLSTSSQ